MSSYVKYRNLHLWTGLILLIPVSIIAVTGFLWNHEKTLGIKQVYDAPPLVDKTAGMVALTSASGSWNAHAAAVDAALEAGRAEWGDGAQLEKIELRSEPGYGILVKVKAPKDSDVMPEEITWSAAEQRVIERKGAMEAGTDWAKVVHDLHTGKIFSKGWGFLWSDSGAMAIMFLGVTGVVLYLIPVFKKRAQKRRNPGRPAPPSPPSSPATRKVPTAPVGTLTEV